MSRRTFSLADRAMQRRMLAGQEPMRAALIERSPFFLLLEELDSPTPDEEAEAGAVGYFADPTPASLEKWFLAVVSSEYSRAVADGRMYSVLITLP